jgi:hypothetical protein
MLKLAADENFDNDIVRGVRLRLPALDFLRVQDVGLRAVDDNKVLAWAAADGRVLFTHDVATLKQLAYDRVARGEPMPGVFEVPMWLAVGPAIDDIALIAECSEPDEWRDRVCFLPLRSAGPRSL